MNTKELTFAYKLRHALDESAHGLPKKTGERLSSARNIALSRKKRTAARTVAAPRLAIAGIDASRAFFRADWSALLGRMSLVIPLLTLVFGLIGLYQYEQHQKIVEIANIDAQVLTDDLPLSAYLDHGFDAFLANGGANKD